MKSKLSLLTMALLVGVSWTGLSANNPAATDPAAATPTTSVTSDAAVSTTAETTAAPADNGTAPGPALAPVATAEGDAAAPAAEVAKVEAPKAEATASETATTAPVAATDTASAPVAATETPAATAVAATDTAQTTVAANDAAPAPAATPAVETPAPATPAAVPANGGNQPGSVIPLIVMDDVPLTDAIKNLARQAGLNYMLDPKIGFGQPGPNGQPVPQPSFSIRWENVTAEQALNALLANYSLQMQEDIKTKIYRISVKDPAAPDPLVTRIIQLKFANPSNIVANVQTTLVDKRSRVVADVRTSQLVVLATDRELVDVETLVTRLDTITKQVLIEARLLETSMSPATTKGIDWSGTLQAQHLAFGNNLQTHSSTESANSTLAQNWPKALFDTAKGFNPGTAFLDADGVNAVFSFLNKNAEAKVISAPRTVTLDNEPARIEVTRASPIINVTPGTVQVSGGSQITYTNLGIILNVTPRISANNYVNLKVSPEVSRVFDTITRAVGSAGVFQADEYDVRKMDTRVMIPSGNTWCSAASSRTTSAMAIRRFPCSAISRFSARPSAATRRPARNQI